MNTATRTTAVTGSSRPGLAIFRRLVPAVAALTAHLACGWGEPHGAITAAAIAALPAADRELFGDESGRLAASYCLIPDQVYSDTNNAPFAMMDSRPGMRYLVALHLPAATQAENAEILGYFLGKTVAALKAGDRGGAARYAGTLCHVLEDWGCPAHAVPGDNMFTLMQQFLPPPARLEGRPLHGPIESGHIDAGIGNYMPLLLGVTQEEAVFRLLHREHEAMVNARASTIPIIQALYAGDTNAVTAWQLKAATKDAEVVADALHTICRLAAGAFDEQEKAALGVVDIASHWPGEATNLYWPQSMFAGSPNWGPPTRGGLLAGGTNLVPLRLRVDAGGATRTNEVAAGLAVGIGRPVTHTLPPSVYARFTVLAGLQAELGDQGAVRFAVIGDGRELAAAEIAGGAAARRLDVPLAGVTNLQLLTKALPGGQPKSNYAVWAEPRLLKQAAAPPGSQGRN